MIKIKIQIFMFLFLLVILCASACTTDSVNGQANSNTYDANKNANKVTSPNTEEVNWHKNMPGNTIQPAPELPQQSNTSVVKQLDSKQTSNMPYTGLIKITSPPAYDASESDVVQKWKEILRWGDFCYEDRIGAITINEIDVKHALLEIDCMNGAYNFDSLFYHVDRSQNTMTAKLMQFEYFVEDDNSKRIIRHLTYIPNGSIGFDKAKKEISNNHRYSGAGQCGWEATYRIVSGKSVLKGMKAQWDCEADIKGNDPAWKPLNLNKLRRAAKKTVYDKIED